MTVGKLIGCSCYLLAPGQIGFAAGAMVAGPVGAAAGAFLGSKFSKPVQVRQVM